MWIYYFISYIFYSYNLLINNLNNRLIQEIGLSLSSGPNQQEDDDFVKSDNMIFEVTVTLI